MAVAAGLVLVAVGMTTVLGQGCKNLAGDIETSLPETSLSIEDIASSPDYKRPILTGISAQTQVDFYFDQSASQEQRSASQQFRIMRENGSLFIQAVQALDRDGPTASTNDDNNQYQFTMKCTENAVDYFFVLRVTILDINDNAPQFVFPNGQQYMASVNKSTPIGSTISVLISATDKDAGPNGQVEYAIMPEDGFVGNESKKFVINARSGHIIIAESLDFEEWSARRLTSFTLIISASDLASPVSNRKQSFTSLTITLVDGNNQGPQFVYPSCFRRENVCLNPEYTVSVASGAETGRLSVFPVPGDGSNVSIVARDGDSLNFPITFSIDATIPEGFERFFSVRTLHLVEGQYEAILTQTFPLMISTLRSLRIVLVATEKSVYSRFSRALIHVTVVAADGQSGASSVREGSLSAAAFVGIGVAAGIFFTAICFGIAYLFCQKGTPAAKYALRRRSRKTYENAEVSSNTMAAAGSREQASNQNTTNTYENVGQSTGASASPETDRQDDNYEHLRMELRNMPREPSDYEALRVTP